MPGVCIGENHVCSQNDRCGSFYVKQRVDEKKQLRKESKILSKEKVQEDQAKSLEQARQIPLDVLASEWLTAGTSIELRCYMVEKLLPTLMLSLEKLLSDATKKGLIDIEQLDSRINPVNLLAQNLMRNNPRFVVSSNTSPYMVSLKAIQEELQQRAYTIKESRMAKVRAEAEARRKIAEEKTRIERLAQETRFAIFSESVPLWEDKAGSGINMLLFTTALATVPGVPGLANGISAAMNFCTEDFLTAESLVTFMANVDERMDATTVAACAKHITTVCKSRRAEQALPEEKCAVQKIEAGYLKYQKRKAHKIKKKKEQQANATVAMGGTTNSDTLPDSTTSVSRVSPPFGEWGEEQKVAAKKIEAGYLQYQQKKTEKVRRAADRKARHAERVRIKAEKLTQAESAVSASGSMDDSSTQ